MIKISLHEAKFFANHGFYPEEQLLGIHFVVNIDVEFETEQGVMTDELTDTVNYEKLYAIAADEMKQTKKLLETVAGGIISRIRDCFPYLHSIRVELKKLNPPLAGPVGYTAITLTDFKKD